MPIIIYYLTALSAKKGQNRVSLFRYCILGTERSKWNVKEMIDRPGHCIRVYIAQVMCIVCGVGSEQLSLLEKAAKVLFPSRTNVHTECCNTKTNNLFKHQDVEQNSVGDVEWVLTVICAFLSFCVPCIHRSEETHNTMDAFVIGRDRQSVRGRVFIAQSFAVCSSSTLFLLTMKCINCNVFPGDDSNFFFVWPTCHAPCWTTEKHTHAEQYGMEKRRKNAFAIVPFACL